MADNPEDELFQAPIPESGVAPENALYGIGALGTALVPGSGVADVMGYSPDPANPGKFLPSFSQNLGRGNYFDAAMQTLGLAGDAMYAVAPVTMGITALPGAALKGAQVLGKSLRGTKAPKKSPNAVLDEIYGQETSLSFGPFALPHVTDHKVKLELLPDIDDPEGAINIAGIVSTGERGEGFGTKALKLITEKADENNLGVTLEVDPVSRANKPDLSVEDLVTFYEREGFIKVNKDYDPDTKITTYEPINPETNKDRFGFEWETQMYRPPLDGRMQSFSEEATKLQPDVPVYPKPQRKWEDLRPGGDYVHPGTNEVLTGRSPSSGRISVDPSGKASFLVSSDNLESVGDPNGALVKTNLFKRSAGWRPNNEAVDLPTLVSVEHRGKHYYTTDVDFTKGVNLSKYPNQRDEPRLRPTVKGNLDFGEEIGTISVRGREHPVYGKIEVKAQGGVVGLPVDDRMINPEILSLIESIMAR